MEITILNYTQTIYKFHFFEKTTLYILSYNIIYSAWFLKKYSMAFIIELHIKILPAYNLM